MQTSSSATAKRPRCRVGQFWQKWEIFCKHYMTFDVIGSKTIKFSEITQNKGYYAVQGHPRSPMSVPIERPYATSY